MLCLPLKRNFGWSFAGAYIRSCRRPEISSGGKHARHQVFARVQSQGAMAALNDVKAMAEQSNLGLLSRFL